VSVMGCVGGFGNGVNMRVSHTRPKLAAKTVAHYLAELQ
jgi:hypothetical protein